MDLNDLEDAARFQELFVKPMVDAVRAELKPLTKTVYATRERVQKLEGNQRKALIGLAGLTFVVASTIGVVVDWAKRKIGLGLILLAVMLMVGCSVIPHPSPLPSPPVPDNLQVVDKGLNWLIVLSVLTFGASVAAFFYLPQHRVSFGLGSGAVGVIALSLLLKVSLPFIPYIALGLGVLAVGFLAYECWREYKTGHSIFDWVQKTVTKRRKQV